MKDKPLKERIREELDKICWRADSASEKHRKEDIDQALQSILTEIKNTRLTKEEILSIFEKMRKDKCRNCEYEFDRNGCIIRQIRQDRRCKGGVDDKDLAHAIYEAQTKKLE